MITQIRLEKFKKVAEEREKNLVLVLEDLHDPFNAGAIMRTADAFGVQEIYLIFEKEKPFDVKNAGLTSSSAYKWLKFNIFYSTKECLSSLKEKGYFFIATTPHKGKSIYETNFDLPKIALLFGNEYRGLSEMAINFADEKVFIPMKGFVESLNISVSVGIFLYEIVKQRNGKYKLDSTEIEELIKFFKEQNSR